MRTCLRCGKEFTAKVWNQKYCTECAPIAHREHGVIWRASHPEKVTLQRARHYTKHRKEMDTYNRTWSLSHSERVVAIKLKHRMEHKAECTEGERVWRLNNPEKAKITRDRIQVKRRRSLGLIPLNIPFDGCEGHHLDKERVVYIPAELHKSIRHNVFTGKNMAAINALAIQFLAQDMRVPTAP